MPSASSNRRRTGARASYHNFIGIERSVADTPAFITMPPIARALYLDLRRQFNGYNNGDICAADGILTKYGWSHSTIHKCLKILREHGLIEVTRQGGIGAMSRTPTLYGFTDQQVIANPAKGISGAMATLAYRNFTPAAKPKRVRKKVEGSRGEREGSRSGLMKVHGVTPASPKVHAVNLQIHKQSTRDHCGTRLSEHVA